MPLETPLKAMSVASEECVHMIKSLKLARIITPYLLTSGGFGKMLFSLCMIYYYFFLIKLSGR